MTPERTIHIGNHTVRVHLRRKSKANPVWLADYTLPVSGTRARLTTREMDLVKAQKRLDEMLEDIRKDIQGDIANGHTETPGEDPRLADLIAWYTSVHLPFTGAKPLTVAKAVQILGQFQLFCQAHHIGRASQISMGRVQEFCAWKDAESGKRMASKTVHNHIAQLRSFFLAAVDMGKLTQSPVTKWVLPRQSMPEVKALSRPDVLSLVAAVRKHQPDYWPIIALAASTGLRIADVIDLRNKQVLKDRITRPQNKTTRRVEIPITIPIREALNAARNESDGPQGRVLVHPRLLTQYRKNSLLRAVQTAAVKAGLPFRPTVKILRASWATYLAESGCPPKVLMELMGHKSLETTLTYYVRAGFSAAESFLSGLPENAGTAGT